ncbi:MAG TPA: IS110 family transposase [Thermoanaerobaculia bacterium]|jgi:transposase|nr:IS110 family transposase [Thermoanaerobaculia bacterium]
MEVLYPRCAGLDVHAGSVTACARIAAGATVTYEHRTVSTTTRGLLALAEWLTAHGCTHVAMEATGVYWKPVWHVLEEHLTLILANAMHIRNVPGRKSDMNDATWIADLLAHGLIRSSFVPPAPIQELRDLTRTRRQLVHEVARHVLRIQKTLEDANLKLTQVMSDIVGVSGRAILNALVAGETDPHRLADLTRGRLKATRADLLDALHGRVTDHHRFLIKLHLTQLDALETAVATIEARIGDALGPFRAAVRLLTTMPGLSETTARVVIAEIGTDMTRFPTVGHLISWAGFCPRLDESAGKRRSTRTRQTTPWLKPTLINAAWAAARKKDCYLRAQFLRIKSRRGAKKAILAVASSMLTAAYFMLRDGVEYHDLGARHFEQRDKEQLAKRLLQRLRDLGVAVEVKAA